MFGAGDAHLFLLKKAFPKLKLIARGDQLKVVGPEREIHTFEMKLGQLLEHLMQFNTLTLTDVEHILRTERSAKPEKQEQSSDIIVFGNAGLVVKARTPNQRKMVTAVKKHDMVFAVGPAGTGKTYTAVALAVRALKEKEVRKIILCRPAVEAGENLGFLPGDMKEKLDPYLQPLYDALYDMLPAERLEQYLETRVVEIAPLAFMRGRTLDHAFVILDEAQNATAAQLKMFLTRMGPSAKFIITGDVTQVDLPKAQPSGLPGAALKLKGIPGIEFVELNEGDVVRHHLVKQIIHAYQ